MSTLREAAQQALEALELAQTDVHWELNSPTRKFLRKAEKTLRAALAQQDEPVEPVAWIQPDHLQKARIAPFLCRVEPTQRCADFVPLYLVPPQRLPLTEEEILKAIGWERAEMYMKLATNFPVDEAKQETLKNARAVERAVWEKNHG